MYANGDNVTYVDSFGVEHFLKRIKKFIGNKKVITNINRIQASGSIMFGYFGNASVDFILKGKKWLDYTSLLPP